MRPLYREKGLNGQCIVSAPVLERAYTWSYLAALNSQRRISSYLRCSRLGHTLTWRCAGGDMYSAGAFAQGFTQARVHQLMSPEPCMHRQDNAVETWKRDTASTALLTRILSMNSVGRQLPVMEGDHCITEVRI